MKILKTSMLLLAAANSFKTSKFMSLKNSLNQPSNKQLLHPKTDFSLASIDGTSFQSSDSKTVATGTQKNYLSKFQLLIACGALFTTFIWTLVFLSIVRISNAIYKTIQDKVSDNINTKNLNIFDESLDISIKIVLKFWKAVERSKIKIMQATTTKIATIFSS